MSKKFMSMLVIASLVATLAAVVYSTPAASADPRFPVSNHQANQLGLPRYHCSGNPHSDSPTGNPHDVPDVFSSSGAQQNPHDDVECTLR